MFNLYDCLRAVLLVTGFAAGIRDRKTAMLGDMIFTGWLGIGLYLLPQTVVSQFSKTTDEFLVISVREMGAQLIGPLLLMYFSQKSKDESVVGAILWSRTLGLFPLLMVLVYGLLVADMKDSRAAWSAIFFFTCIWLSNVVQLLKTRPSVGRREQKGPLSVVCRLTFLYMFLAGLFAMTFPKMLLSVLPKGFEQTSLHYLNVRILGSLLFSGIFLSWYAPSFRQSAARKTFFIGNLLTFGLIVLAAALNAVTGGRRMTPSPWVGIAFGVLPLALPSLGLYLTIKLEGNSS